MSTGILGSSAISPEVTREFRQASRSCVNIELPDGCEADVVDPGVVDGQTDSRILCGRRVLKAAIWNDEDLPYVVAQMCDTCPNNPNNLPDSI